MSSRSPDTATAQSRRTRIFYALAIVVALAVLGLHIYAHRAYIEDDAFISLRYSQRLAQGKGLTWTDGERVEGYTNLLWVLGAAALGALGIDLVVALRILGVGGVAAALCAVAAAYPPRAGRGPLPALSGGLAIAASGSMAAWAVGGLEQPLLAALFAWALVRLYPTLESSRVHARDLVVPSLLLGLACLTRADAAMLAGATGLGWMLARGIGWRSLVGAATLGVFPAAFTLGQFLFRRAYYGMWVPNTAHAKVSLNAVRLGNGLTFLSQGLLWASPLVVAALVAVVLAFVGRDQALSRRVRLVVAPLVVWATHVVLIGGGDTMPARRHMVPIVVLCALLVAEATAWFVARPRRLRIGGVAAISALLAVFGILQRTDVRNLNASRFPWAWDGMPVGLLLRQAFAAQRPLVAVDAAGGVPYYAELPALDMLGLTDRYIAEHPGKDFGSGKIGHELGDGPYTLSRKPDLIIFCAPRNEGRPCWKGGREMVRDPEFRARYRLLTFEGLGEPRVRSHVWVRATDGPLAIARSDERIEIPGYYAASLKNYARLEQGALVALATANNPGAIGDLQVPAGAFQLELDTSGAEPVVEVVGARAGKLGQGHARVALTVPEGGDTLTIRISAADERPTQVRKVTLSRAAP